MSEWDDIVERGARALANSQGEDGIAWDDPSDLYAASWRLDVREVLRAALEGLPRVVRGGPGVGGFWKVGGVGESTTDATHVLVPIGTMAPLEER